MLKSLFCRFLILMAFVVAAIEVILELCTFSLYSKLRGSIGIKKMFGYKILKYSEKFM